MGRQCPWRYFPTLTFGWNWPTDTTFLGRKGSCQTNRQVQTLTDALLKPPFLRKPTWKVELRWHLPDITVIISIVGCILSRLHHLTLYLLCLQCVKLPVFQTNAPIQWEAEWGCGFLGNINNSNLKFHKSYQFLCIFFSEINWKPSSTAHLCSVTMDCQWSFFFLLLRQKYYFKPAPL